jgi:outer membrane immunogenic protein
MKKFLLATVATAALASSAISSSASAADLAPAPMPAVYAKAPMVSPATNWSGFYAGANVGYGWGNGDMSLADATNTLSAESGFPKTSQSIGNRANGAIGGGQIGYIWQMGSFVTGLEADIQGAGIRATASSPVVSTFDLTFVPGSFARGTSEQKLSWFGTVRGRVGVTATPNVLVFGTGGLAYGNVRSSGNAIIGDGIGPTDDNPAQINQTEIGWAAGAGAEWMFARNWSAKVEYLHVDLGTSSAVGFEREGGVPAGTPDAVGYTWHHRFDIVRAGVNYHFN